jgi:hypothetical protein
MSPFFCIYGRQLHRKSGSNANRDSEAFKVSMVKHREIRKYKSGKEQL